MTDYDFNPALTGYTRVFIIDGRARPDHEPEFLACFMAGSLSKSFGDVTDIDCPHPNVPGQFVKVGQIRGGDSRATIDLTGHHALDLRSRMLELGLKGCEIDVMVHYGDCEDLEIYNDFKKVMFLEDAFITEYSTTDLGTLEKDGQAVIDETAPISAQVLYDYVPLVFSEEASDVVTNEVIDVVICDDVSCGNCEEMSDGCKKIYALTLAAGGSPGTPPDVVFSLDGGLTWYAHDVDTLGAAEDPNALACLGEYMVVVSNASNSLHYTLLEDITAITDPVWVENAVGFVAGGEPNDIWSVGTKAWIVGDMGYIYLCTDPTAGVTVQDAGETTISQLNAVHGLNKYFAVAVGNDGVVVVSEDGERWALTPTNPTAPGVDLTSVWVKSKTEWWVTADDGNLYYTLNGGELWAQKGFNGDGVGVAEAIIFATDSIAYLSHTTAAPLGRLLASFDGGYSWIVLPQQVGVMVPTDGFNALAACITFPKLLVAVGLHDNGTDGVIVAGSS